jgi:mannonate dehydratase
VPGVALVPELLSGSETPPSRVITRFFTMHESPYHGLNFCQGTIAEMLDDPAREICDVIRWFGERSKIFNVHFRNIKGRKLDFMEAFPDEGDIDMPRTFAAYRDAGYP